MKAFKKKFKESSKHWLMRQMTDPYVKKAKQEGYRARSAYKLLDIQDKFRLLKPGMKILDLGAAPGGWLQVTSQIVGKIGQVVAVDLLPIEPLLNAIILQGDFGNLDLKSLGPFDGILSDMAPASCGISKIDHLRLMVLLESVIDRFCDLLKPKGFFIGKVFQGGTEATLLNQLKRHFGQIKHFKPLSSRLESCEMYVIGTGFRSKGL